MEASSTDPMLNFSATDMMRKINHTDKKMMIKWIDGSLTRNMEE
jgi:hypothetical protein